MNITYNVGSGTKSKEVLTVSDLEGLSEFKFRKYIYNVKCILRDLYNSTSRNSFHKKLNSEAKNSLPPYLTDAKALYKTMFLKEYVDPPIWSLPCKGEADRIREKLLKTKIDETDGIEDTYRKKPIF